MRPPALIVGLLLYLLASTAHALFIVNLPWVRPGKAGATTALYMNVTSTDGATLVAVRTEVSESTAIRGAGTKAAALNSLALPAGTLVALEPGGIHIDLLKLKHSLKAGDRVPITLTIEDADGTRKEIPLSVEVRVRSALDDERRAHGH